MDRIGFIEILGRRGEVVSRIPLTAGEITIGRAYDCAVILDDPYVDPHHAQIQYDPAERAFRAEDQGSANGIWLADTRVGEDGVLVPSGGELRMGRTRLRLVTAETPVPPALPEPTELPLSAVGPPRRIAALSLSALGLILFLSYLSDYTEYDTLKVLGEAIGVTVMMAIWAGLWALGTRLSRGRSEFLRHLGVLSLLTLIMSPVTWGAGLIAFAFPVFPIEWALSYGVGLAFLGILIFWHLAVASRMARVGRALVSTVVTLALLGIVLVFQTIDLGSTVTIQKSLDAIEPVPQSIIATESLDEFLESVEAMRPKLQEMTEEKQETAATRRATR